MPLTRVRYGVIAILLFATPSFGVDLARVEWLNRRCGMLIVKSTLGYALAEHVGGGMLSEGDNLVGDFSGSRNQKVKNATTQSELSMWVEQVFDTREAAFEKLPERCRD